MTNYLHTWLKLSTTPKLNLHQQHQLLDAVGIQQLADEPACCRSFNLPEASLQHLLSNQSPLLAPTLAWLDNPQHHCITFDSPAYPPLLREISDPPLLLYVKGHVDCLQHPQLAIVGTRRPSASGQEASHRLSMELAQAKLTITSGLAIGIDACAHRAALQAKGTTIAVLGCGLHHCYPRQHQALAEQIIAEQGALISEFHLQQTARPWHFPQRNRIMTGLSLGIVVVEALCQGGSMVSAKLALEQNRSVFAVPGSIFNPQSQGCHHLIQQGAELVASCDDILISLGWTSPTEPLLNSFSPGSHKSLAPTAQKLVECVGFEPTTVDDIIRRSGLTAQQVCSMLPTLVLNKQLIAVADGYQRAG